MSQEESKEEEAGRETEGTKEKRERERERERDWEINEDEENEAWLLETVWAPCPNQQGSLHRAGRDDKRHQAA